MSADQSVAELISRFIARQSAMSRGGTWEVCCLSAASLESGSKGGLDLGALVTRPPQRRLKVLLLLVPTSTSSFRHTRHGASSGSHSCFDTGCKLLPAMNFDPSDNIGTILLVHDSRNSLVYLLTLGFCFQHYTRKNSQNIVLSITFIMQPLLFLASWGLCILVLGA